MPGNNLQSWLDENMFNDRLQTTVTPNHLTRATLETVSLLQHEQQLLEGTVAKTQGVTSCLEPAHTLTSPTNLQ